jgi:nitrite reductase (NO-forming)
MKRRSIFAAVMVCLCAGALLVGARPMAGPAVAHASPPASLGNVAADPTAVPPPIFPRTTPRTVTVDLVAKEVVADLGPGKPFFFWTFNGTVPGPMIRVMEGDTVTLNLTNDPANGDPHNIDLHAVMGPGGGAAVTNVAPGETKTLQFQATRAGSYIYHCAGEGMPWEHISHGMFGMIMVEPVGGLPPVDKEFYVGQSEWYLTKGLKKQAHDVRYYDLDEDKATEERPDFYTFNGHTQALTQVHDMMADQGDSVRLFFVNSGPNKGANFHVIGQVFDKVYTGHPETFTRNEETLHVPPGSAAVLEFSAKVPGTYMLVDHALYRVPMGAVGYLMVNYTTPPAPGDPLGSWPLDLYAPQTSGTGH